MGEGTPSETAAAQAKDRASRQAAKAAAKTASKQAKAGKEAQAGAGKTDKVRTTEPSAVPKAQQAQPGEVGRQLRGVLTAAHPKQAVVLGLAVGAAAAASGRPIGQSLLAGAAALVTQAVAGIDNDVADAARDTEAGQTAGNPVAAGTLPAGNASFAALCLFIVAVPLAFSSGWAAGAAILATVPVALVYNHMLRRTPLSPLPWMVTFPLLLLALTSITGRGGGWGGAPRPLLLVVVALLGLGVHFLTSLPDLVADNKTGVRHLPLRLALKTGAPRLLILSAIVTAAAAIGFVVLAITSGLRA